MRDLPLRHSGFRRFLIARALSAAGGWMQTVAAGYLVYRLTGSAVQVGMLAAVAKGPSIVVSPLGGWLADRVDRRRLAVILAAAQIPPVALLAVLSLDNVISTLEIFVLTFWSALPAGLNRPVLAELVPDLVPEPLCKRAMTDAAATFNLAGLCGPAIGGALVATLGVVAAFGVTTLSFVGVVVALLSIRTASIRPRERPRDQCGLTAGARVMWRALLLRTLLETALTFFVFVGPLEQIMPVVAADHGDGAQYIGLMLAAIALGGLLGHPFVRRLQEREVNELVLLGFGLVVAGVLMIGLALSKGLALDIVAIVLIGATWELIWVTESTGIHFRSPAGLSGQAMGALYMVAGVSVALGSVLAGWAADRIGLQWSLAIAGAGLILLGPCPVVWASHHMPGPEFRREAEQPAGRSSAG